MSVTTTWGWASVGAVDQLVVVRGDAHDLEVGLEAEQGPHALAHDEVVVGEEHGDPPVGHSPFRTANRRAGSSVRPSPAGGVAPSPGRVVTTTLGPTGAPGPYGADMRIESSVTSISWIPSEAVKGVATKVPFEMGSPTTTSRRPRSIDDLDALRRADRFRFANELRAWIEVEDGRIVGHGHLGQRPHRLHDRAPGPPRDRRSKPSPSPTSAPSPR